MKGTPNNGLSIMSVAAMRRFFYPFEGIDVPIDWMCCTTARIQKNKQEEPMEPNNKIPVYYETAAYARENGELELFRLSHRTNIACKNDIQDAISTGCTWISKRLRRYSTSMVQSASPSYLRQLFSTNHGMAAFLLPTRIGHSLCICRKDSRQAALIAGATTSLTLILPFWMASSGRLAEKSGSARILL